MITEIKINFNHFIFIPIKRIVIGITSIVTIDMTYLVDKMGCEIREIIVTTNSVPKKTDTDNHKTKRYSENDFVKLIKRLITIRLYIKIVNAME
jgi:hypothetical protein